VLSVLVNLTTALQMHWVYERWCMMSLIYCGRKQTWSVIMNLLGWIRGNTENTCRLALPSNYFSATLRCSVPQLFVTLILLTCIVSEFGVRLKISDWLVNCGWSYMPWKSRTRCRKHRLRDIILNNANNLSPYLGFQVLASVVMKS
jgi:hypothetical protein